MRCPFTPGNGPTGVSFAANSYVNDSEFAHNVIGTNNINLTDGTVTVMAHATTGILSWFPTKYHFVVTHNTIFANTYGIWFTRSLMKISGLQPLLRSDETGLPRAVVERIARGLGPWPAAARRVEPTPGPPRSPRNAPATTPRRAAPLPQGVGELRRARCPRGPAGTSCRPRIDEILAA